MHDFNVALDKTIVRPVARTATQILPDPVEQGVVNFASNLELPGVVVNDILQLKMAKAAENTARFLINTTTWDRWVV